MVVESWDLMVTAATTIMIRKDLSASVLGEYLQQSDTLKAGLAPMWMQQSVLFFVTKQQICLVDMNRSVRVSYGVRLADLAIGSNRGSHSTASTINYYFKER